MRGGVPRPLQPFLLPDCFPFPSLYYFPLALLFFLAKLRVDLDEEADDKRCRAAEDRPEEEVAVADELLQPSGHHARQHHSQGHEARADGVVGRAVLALREIDEVEHVGREAKSVAKLLDEDAGVDDP